MGNRDGHGFIQVSELAAYVQDRVPGQQRVNPCRLQLAFRSQTLVPRIPAMQSVDRANGALWQFLTHAAQQIQIYSITSLARASSEGGTVMPSALAVFSLITRSKVVGC